MLESLHVKNLALIKDIEVEFSQGLNILSGETGAGKSILLGSINLALGSRSDADLIRTGEEEAFIELVFSLEDKRVQEALALLEVKPEEGRIIITRKIKTRGSLCRINGETVPLKTLQEVSTCLLDIHGQHEHQTLLQEENHQKVLDEFGKDRILPAKEAYKQAYLEYRKKKEKLNAFGENPEELEKRLDFLSFETNEIEQARIQKGEEDALTKEFQTLNHGKQIEEGLSLADSVFSEEFSDGLFKAIRSLGTLVKFDASLEALKKSLEDLSSVAADIKKELESRLDNYRPDEERMRALDDRLDMLERLKRKYGNSEEEILKTYEKLLKEQEELKLFTENREEALLDLKGSQEKLVLLGKELNRVREEQALLFDRQMEEALSDLNFMEVHFKTELKETNRYTAEGASEVRFLISLNHGEPLKPLSRVASGGELSRIMLAIKTIVTSSDTIGTMIFDEIDAGISGKTGRMVAEKLSRLAENHQVICISHLPQIVAMADHHYLIYKEAEGEETVSRIRVLSEEESLRELSRLLGSGEYTESAYESARNLRKEMKGSGEKICH